MNCPICRHNDDCHTSMQGCIVCNCPSGGSQLAGQLEEDFASLTWCLSCGQFALDRPGHQETCEPCRRGALPPAPHPDDLDSWPPGHYNHQTGRFTVDP